MWILNLIVVNYWISSFGQEISKNFEIKSPFLHTEDMITVLKLADHNYKFFQEIINS